MQQHHLHCNRREDQGQGGLGEGVPGDLPSAGSHFFSEVWSDPISWDCVQSLNKQKIWDNRSRKENQTW